MLQIVLVRPGSTDFDEQGRIKGTLDIPLSENGTGQVARAVVELGGLDIEAVYSAPCEAAEKTAEAVAKSHGLKSKRLEKLRNLNHGLWHGKLIEEVKQCQPKVYRQWQDHPETVCPPEGESLSSAQERVRVSLQKLMKRHKHGVIALVVPEPLASLVRCFLDASELGDLWKAECDCGRWEMIDIQPEKLVAS
jgi:broad specificity phosphatase PhoE